MSDGFVKIYGDKLLSSTLWDEAMHVRIVFLALLAKADPSGFVRVPSIAGLARIANVPEDLAREAMEVLTAPDERSSNPAEDGRRVSMVHGGWQLVSYQLYRDYRSDRQERDRVRQGRKRERDGERDRRDMSHASRPVTADGVTESVTGVTCHTRHGDVAPEVRSQNSEIQNLKRGCAQGRAGASAQSASTASLVDPPSAGQDAPPRPACASDAATAAQWQQGAASGRTGGVSGSAHGDVAAVNGPGIVGSAHVAEAREGWAEAYFGARAGAAPRPSGDLLREAVAFALDVSRAHGVTIRDAARSIAAASLALPAADRLWALTRLDPYAPLAPTAKPRDGRVPRSKGTTAADFESCDDIETQMRRHGL